MYKCYVLLLGTVLIAVTTDLRCYKLYNLFMKYLTEKRPGTVSWSSVLMARDLDSFHRDCPNVTLTSLSRNVCRKKHH